MDDSLQLTNCCAKQQQHNQSLMRSNRFGNNSDHRHFENIFRVIDECEWTKSVVVVNKLIAEYATGTIKKCANKLCMKEIVVLVEDEQTYDYDHNNAHKLGYKWCYEYNLHYCDSCMEQAQPCGSKYCGILSFIPECGNCDMCDSVVYKCRCHGYQWQCSSCSFTTCNNCYGIDPCVQCRRRFCENCSAGKPAGYDQYIVCNSCHDDTVHKCDKCEVECKLLFKSNQTLYGFKSDNLHHKMEKCNGTDCDDFICCNCEENGRRVLDTTGQGIYQYFCNRHITN